MINCNCVQSLLVCQNLIHWTKMTFAWSKKRRPQLKCKQQKFNLSLLWDAYIIACPSSFFDHLCVNFQPFGYQVTTSPNETKDVDLQMHLHFLDQMELPTFKWKSDPHWNEWKFDQMRMRQNASQTKRTFLCFSRWAFLPLSVYPLPDAAYFKPLTNMKTLWNCLSFVPLVANLCLLVVFVTNFCPQVLWNANFNFFPLTYLFINLKHLDLFLLFCRMEKWNNESKAHVCIVIPIIVTHVVHLTHCDKMHIFASSQDVVVVKVISLSCMQCNTQGRLWKEWCHVVKSNVLLTWHHLICKWSQKQLLDWNLLGCHVNVTFIL